MPKYSLKIFGQSSMRNIFTILKTYPIHLDKAYLYHYSLQEKPFPLVLSTYETVVTTWQPSLFQIFQENSVAGHSSVVVVQWFENFPHSRCFCSHINSSLHGKSSPWSQDRLQPVWSGRVLLGEKQKTKGNIHNNCLDIYHIFCFVR